MATVYKIYRSNNPGVLGELVYEGDSLSVTLTDQPFGKWYYKFIAENEYGASVPSAPYEGVSIQPGQTISFNNGNERVTVNSSNLTGADTLHLESRNADGDAWVEVYAGTNTTYEINSAGNVRKQWRYHGTYGTNFKGSESSVATYTAPSIGAPTLSCAKTGDNLKFTYTGGDGAVIAELMTGSTVVGQFASKSITIPIPTVDTTYTARLKAGFVSINSNAVIVALPEAPSGIYVRSQASGVIEFSTNPF